MALRFYNFLARDIEEFKPLNDSEVGYYSCGPTVYDYAHIGHARTYTFADILQRTLEFNGFEVNRVMNITDVGHLTSDSDTGDDKMEKGAVRENKSVWDIAKFYTQDFFEMLELLNIKKPVTICKATDHVEEMIDLIQRLEENGFTYAISDGVYFDTSKFPEYGKLTGRTLAELQKQLKAGVRVEMVSGKKNPTDFALWKLTPAGVKRQMEWDSPWGKGFPGWHIECSAMSMKYLGETFDIHTGGVDHVFIHHTNEIAQSEAASGKQFVRFWMEGEHLLVEGEKMSKSLNNFFRVSNIVEKGYDSLALRYLFLTAHYRTQLNFTWDSLMAAQNALNNLRDEIASWEDDGEVNEEFEKRFLDAANDDLNIPQAIAVVWEVVKADIPSGDKKATILRFDEVLGLRLSEVQKSLLPEGARQLIEKREKVRKAGNYEESDRLRSELAEMGVAVEDTKDGPKWKVKSVKSN